MSEQTNTKPSLLVDREAGERYEYVVQKGREIFKNSALVDSTQEIVSRDLDRIVRFHREVSPTNPALIWRLTKEEKSIERGEIADSSFFNNWEAPSLGEVSGGKYIAEKVVEFSQELDPARSPDENLRELNSRIGEDVRDKHPKINFTESLRNVPYGSIAAIKIDATQGNIEVANAGDAFVLVVKSDGEPMLLTTDDVTSRSQTNLSEAKKILIFSDGAVPLNIDIHTREGQKRFVSLLDEEGLEGLHLEIERAAGKDPDFEKHPRFSNIDDMLILLINAR